MGELGGFLKIERVNFRYRDPAERVADVDEFLDEQPVDVLREQGARCMECGIPFCHNGCPLGNLIPDWNDLVYRDRWADAIRQLHATNNFPEFTGRLCPAPCEASCVLEIREGEAVTIKQIENAIIDRAWDEGWVVPQPPKVETGRTVAVVGAGPAGMAAAQQLRRAGHAVTLFERDEAIGGLIRFGVPQFKIEKALVERRAEQLRGEGVDIRCGVDVGRDVTAEQLREDFDAVVVCTGSRVPRDLPAEGRDLDGIHFAMDYLYERQRAVDAGREHGDICAKGKHVVVIGGGDTGADCVGNAIREGAVSVAQLEILPKPPDHRPDDRTPWPLWPQKYRLSYAMEEALEVGKGEQDYAVTTTRFLGEDGRVRAVEVAEARDFKPVDGTEHELQADLVLLAMGFLGPEPELLDGLGLARDARGNAEAPVYETTVPGVFAAGDARRGQSLIVWAINEGRQAARMCDRFLGGVEPLHTGNVAAQDEGPMGPPSHAQGGMPAGGAPATPA